VNLVVLVRLTDRAMRTIGKLVPEGMRARDLTADELSLG
jgi:hypothetical protein